VTYFISRAGERLSTFINRRIGKFGFLNKHRKTRRFLRVTFQRPIVERTNPTAISGVTERVWRGDVPAAHFGKECTRFVGHL